MNIIIVQHATSEWNRVGRIQGQTDICLSSQGRAEALLLGESLRDLGCDFIVSSDLARAKETAEIINSILRVPLQADARLRECSFGNIEGLTRQQAIEQYGSVITSHWDDQCQSYDFRPFGGECRDEVLARHLDFFKLLAKDNMKQTVLFVGHGRGTCTFLAEFEQPCLKQGEYRTIQFNA